jgi:hypothetical protein
VPFDTGVKFVKCPYCASQIYVDRSGAGFYYALPYMVKENDAIGMFKRWAAGSTKAKDLDKLAQVAGVKRQYFPVYMFKRDLNGVEQVFIETAGSTTLPGLHSLKVPAGDLKIFDPSFDTQGAELVKPDIEMLSYLNTLPGKPKEQALVYFPIWKIDYVFNQKKFEIVLDGSSGEVFSAEFPMRSSTAYVAVAAVGFVAIAAEGLVATSSMLAAAVLIAVTVVAVFGAALFVARRM